jgi:hypothetical protein
MSDSAALLLWLLAMNVALAGLFFEAEKLLRRTRR